jgi:hypothetical protein
MPALKLLDRQPETDPVLTETLADAVSLKAFIYLPITSTDSSIYHFLRTNHCIAATTAFTDAYEIGPQLDVVI